MSAGLVTVIIPGRSLACRKVARAGVRTDQTGARIPPILVARLRRGVRRVGADDPDKAEVFERGYLAGLQDPNTPPLLVLSPELLDPELLDVYTQGTAAGRADGSASWILKSDLNSDGNGTRRAHIDSCHARAFCSYVSEGGTGIAGACRFSRWHSGGRQIATLRKF
jgi:hypothetical protein